MQTRRTNETPDDEILDLTNVAEEDGSLTTLAKLLDSHSKEANEEDGTTQDEAIAWIRPCAHRQSTVGCTSRATCIAHDNAPFSAIQ